jgi:two-component system NarL family sensor kinase
MKTLLTAAVILLSAQTIFALTPTDSLLQLIRQTNDAGQLAALHREVGVELKKDGKLDQAVAHYKKALSLFQKLQDTPNVARCLNNLGSAYTVKGAFEHALESYLNSLRIYEQLSDEEGQVKSHINIGNFFARQQQFQKAESHYSTALGMLEAGDLKNEALLNLNLGGINTDPRNQEGNPDKALVYFQQAKAAFRELNDLYNLAGIANNIGVVKEQQFKLQEAYASYREALELREQLQDMIGISQSYHNLGNVLRKQKKHEQAIEKYMASLEAAREADARSFMQHALHNLSGTFAEMGEHQKAFDYRLQSDLLKDSLYNEEKSLQLAELETKYETEKKDKELLIKEASIRQKTIERNTFMVVLIITVVLSAAAILVYHQRQRTMRQLAHKNEELHRHRISEMLKEQEIKSINAMLEGQDKERKRIAEDLHDRLGSTLSAVKLHLNSINGDVVKTVPMPLYQNLNGLLDKAVSEVRDIAHNMVSGVLTKFGLVAALQDLKGTIEASGKIKVELLVMNLDERLDGQVEITLYRIIQELVSNILKHAKATEITIQLNRFNQELLVMVEDNGIGFEPAMISREKGMGLRNVESRATALGGRINVDSGRGRGTTTTIEIPIAESLTNII